MWLAKFEVLGNRENHNLATTAISESGCKTFVGRERRERKGTTHSVMAGWIFDVHIAYTEAVK